MTEIRVGDAPPPMTPPTPTDQPAERIDLFADPTPAETAHKSPMQALEEALAAPAEAIPVLPLRVPLRRGVVLEFDPGKINKTNRKAWQKRVTKVSRRPGQADEVDDFMFACLVLANTCVGVKMNGHTATDNEGTPLTFAHAQLWAMVGARDPQECIEKLYANDQHVTAASGEVLLASGIDDDMTADPTAG